MWLKELLRNQNEPTATIILGDYWGAIALAKNPQLHSRTKHIDIQHHYVREMQADGKADLQYVPTEDQVADGLTKALPKGKFIRFRDAIGLDSAVDQNLWVKGELGKFHVD